MPEKLISAIIPLRITDGVYEAESRLELILDTIPNDIYNVIVVDYGTARHNAKIIEEICKRYAHVSLVRVDKEFAPFSIGEARDIGVQSSKTPLIVFNDIDFYGPESMYRRIHAEAKSREMHKNIYEFFCVPVMWLTEREMPKLHEIISNSLQDDFSYRYHSAYIEHNKRIVDTIAFGSSAIVANKYNYLSLGGHNRNFTGHGAEDYDILHRLSSTFPRGPRTGNYLQDTKNNGIERYEGFRAFFATYGIDVFQRGIFLVHMWHPTRSMPNYFQSKKNFEILTKVMLAFDRHKQQPLPLSDLTSQEKTLLLIDPSSRASESFRYAMPLMGDVSMIPEKTFVDGDHLIEFHKRHGFTRIGFLNPYGNNHRLELYNRIRTSGVDYWTFDRGALPDSWFFDPCGFNADSKTYDAVNWDIDYDSEELEHSKNKIKELRYSEMTLEENGPRQSLDDIRRIFNLTSQKILFVPMQRPNDTVMRYFADPVGGMDNFVEWVNYVSDNLDPAEWAVIVKRHPLEKSLPELSNVFVCPDNIHIHDLLEVSDKVMLVNSGTGVLSMAFEKPVVYCGNPFYKVDGVNYQAKSKSDALRLVVDQLEFDKVASLKFLHYLWNSVYSFAKASYVKVPKENGATITIVNHLLFSEIRGIGNDLHYFGSVRTGLSLDAPLFSSFGGREGIKKSVQIKGVTHVAPKPMSKVKPTPRVVKSVSKSYGVLLNSSLSGFDPLNIVSAEGISRNYDGHAIEQHLVDEPILVSGDVTWHHGKGSILELSDADIKISLKGDIFKGNKVDFLAFSKTPLLGNEIFVQGESDTVKTVSLSDHLIKFTLDFSVEDEVCLIFSGASKQNPVYLEIITAFCSGFSNDETIGSLISSKMIKSQSVCFESKDGDLNWFCLVDNQSDSIVKFTPNEISLQLRLKGSDNKTAVSIPVQIEGDISPGLSFYTVENKITKNYLREVGIVKSYTDIIYGGGKFGVTGRDQSLADLIKSLQ